MVPKCKALSCSAYMSRPMNTNALNNMCTRGASKCPSTDSRGVHNKRRLVQPKAFLTASVSGRRDLWCQAVVFSEWMHFGICWTETSSSHEADCDEGLVCSSCYSDPERGLAEPPRGESTPCNLHWLRLLQRCKLWGREERQESPAL